MDTRQLRALASDATALIAQAAANASLNLSQSKVSREKYLLRILSPLMGSLMEAHHALQDAQLGQDEKISKRLPMLLKQLEAICMVRSKWVSQNEESSSAN